MEADALDECGIGTISRMLRKAIDRFQYIWVAMIGEMYELIVEYLGNGFRQEPANYIEMGWPIKIASV